MIRLATFLVAFAVGCGALLADFSPPQISFACQGEWQSGSEFRLGRFAMVVENDRWAPELFNRSPARRMTVFPGGGHSFSYGRVETDGTHWYIYSEGEHMGMLSGNTGRILMDSPRGLFQGTCSSL